MKKHAALLLAVALAGSMFLASCSGDGSGASAPESSGGTESQSASAEESSGAETPELSGELVVMTLAGEPFVPAWQDQAAVFTRADRRTGYDRFCTSGKTCVKPAR